MAFRTRLGPPFEVVPFFGSAEVPVIQFTDQATATYAEIEALKGDHKMDAPDVKSAGRQVVTYDNINSSVEAIGICLRLRRN